MRDQLVEWMTLSSEGKAGEPSWIARVRIDHATDREIVGWAERDAEETTEDYADRIFAMAQNDAEAMGMGDQLYMLRIFRPGSLSESQERRPLRILMALPENAVHSLSTLGYVPTDSPQFHAAVAKEVERRLRNPAPILDLDTQTETPEERAKLDAEAASILKKLQGDLKMMGGEGEKSEDASPAGVPCGEAQKSAPRDIWCEHGFRPANESCAHCDHGLPCCKISRPSAPEAQKSAPRTENVTYPNDCTLAGHAHGPVFNNPSSAEPLSSLPAGDAPPARGVS